MNCIKCNAIMIDNCCPKCGYLSNGNSIRKVELNDENNDLKEYNIDFAYMNQNNKAFRTMLLGPLYYSYRDHFTVGFFLGIIDVFCILFLLELIMTNSILIAILLFYLIITRGIYYSFSNYFCLKLDRIKINYIKKHKKNFDEYLLTHNSRNYLLLLITVLAQFATIFTFFIYLVNLS